LAYKKYTQREVQNDCKPIKKIKFVAVDASCRGGFFYLFLRDKGFVSIQYFSAQQPSRKSDLNCSIELILLRNVPRYLPSAFKIKTISFLIPKLRDVE
jgi:hypothetical protein